jgi:hypothetical protein
MYDYPFTDKFLDRKISLFTKAIKRSISLALNVNESLTLENYLDILSKHIIEQNTIALFDPLLIVKEELEVGIYQVGIYQQYNYPDDCKHTNCGISWYFNFDGYEETYIIRLEITFEAPSVTPSDSNSVIKIEHQAINMLFEEDLQLTIDAIIDDVSYSSIMQLEPIAIALYTHVDL